MHRPSSAQIKRRKALKPSMREQDTLRAQALIVDMLQACELKDWGRATECLKEVHSMNVPPEIRQHADSVVQHYLQEIEASKPETRKKMYLENLSLLRLKLTFITGAMLVGLMLFAALSNFASAPLPYVPLFHVAAVLAFISFYVSMRNRPDANAMIWSGLTLTTCITGFTFVILGLKAMP